MTGGTTESAFKAWETRRKNNNDTAWNKGLTKEIDERINYIRPTSFKKGQQAWNKGIPVKEETKQKLSKITKKQWKDGVPQYIRDKISKAGKGRIVTKETRDKIGIKLLGHLVSQEAREKIRQANIGKTYSEEQLKQMSIRMTGEKNPSWQGGKSFEPYTVDWNNSLRESIRKRDKHRCQECFRHQNELRTKSNKPYKLMIHHIDYNKQNNNPKNLISLCRSCHSQTNFNRDDWVSYYQKKVCEVT